MSLEIFVDMDGVISSFVGGAAKAFGETEEDLVRRWPPGEYSTIVPLKTTDDELWARLDATPNFWESLEKYPHTDFLLDACRKITDHVFILSQPSRDANSSAGKVKWMQTHLHPKYRDYILTPRKHLLAAKGRVLIDDSDDNIEKWTERGGFGILFPRVWNQNHALRHNPIPYVISELGEAQTCIE